MLLRKRGLTCVSARPRLPCRRRYQGYLDVFRQVVRHQGLRGLYSGIVPDYCKVVPGVAITFCVYELGKRALAVESNAMQR